MLISKTGNNTVSPVERLLSCRRGITFVEVMVTVVVLSVGLVGIFKVFHSSLSYLTHLTNRIYASNLLDNRFAKVQRMLSGYHTLPVELDQEENIHIGARIFPVKKGTGIRQIGDFIDIFRLDLSVGWKEGQRNITLKRTFAVEDWSYVPKEKE